MRIPRRVRASADPCGEQPVQEVVEAYDRLIDDAITNTVDRYRAGASEDAVLTETLIAVRSAQAVQQLTGVEWDEQLQARVDDRRDAES